MISRSSRRVKKNWRWASGVVAAAKARVARESQARVTGNARTRSLVRLRRLRAPRDKEWGRMEAAEPNQICQTGVSKIYVGPTGGLGVPRLLVDCCKLRVVGLNLSHRCRTEVPLAVVEQAVLEPLAEGCRTAQVTMPTHNGMQFTSAVH